MIPASARKGKIEQNEDSQYNAVITENPEIMFADITHEKADHENGNKESTQHPDKENRGFHR